MLANVYQIRPQAELPFYCNPLHLFIAVWLVMLATFMLRVSYTTYPDISLAILLFASSLASFLIGHWTVRSAYFAVGSTSFKALHYQIDIKKLRRFHLCLFVVAVSIVVLNLKLHGLPPVFGFFGGDTLNYQEYGSLRQILFPAIMALFITAPLEPLMVRRWLLYMFGPLCALVYVSRGYLLIMLMQLLMVFSLRTKLSKVKLYLIAIAALGFAVFISDLIGNSRNSLGSEALLSYMQIRRSYYDWPTAYLWLISYISTPISNMCWIINAHQSYQPVPVLFSSLLPGFLAPEIPKNLDYGSGNIIDGVHSYLAKYYLNFWIFGIFGVNYLWGFISGYLSLGDRLSRNYLTSAVLLSCIAFFFFEDFLSILIIYGELLLLWRAQAYFGKPILRNRFIEKSRKLEDKNKMHFTKNV